MQFRAMTREAAACQPTEKRDGRRKNKKLRSAIIIPHHQSSFVGNRLLPV
jgi:hypothetical protein